MGQTRGQLKVTLRTNLDDSGVTFYSDADLNDSIQDAYDDIAILTQCITKNTVLNWVDNLSYYDMKNQMGVTDYLGTTAIFNDVTNRWLRDDLGLRDFDRLRKDWEKWVGTPQFWTPSDPVYIAIAPKYPLSNGTFKLIYWATAPMLENDSNIFLIASDCQNLLEFYSTADMLEQAQESIKANEYWEKYYNGIEEYRARVKSNNRTDLLLRV